MTSRADRRLRAITVPAHRDQLAPLRDRIRQWLVDSDIPAPLCADIILAADEALANAAGTGLIAHFPRHT